MFFVIIAFLTNLILIEIFKKNAENLFLVHSNKVNYKISIVGGLSIFCTLSIFFIYFILNDFTFHVLTFSELW